MVGNKETRYAVYLFNTGIHTLQQKKTYKAMNDLPWELTSTMKIKIAKNGFLVDPGHVQRLS